MKTLEHLEEYFLIFKEHNVLREYRRKIGKKPDLPCFLHNSSFGVICLGDNAVNLSNQGLATIQKAILVWQLVDKSEANAGAIIRTSLIMRYRDKWLVPLDSFQQVFDCKIQIS